MAEFNAEPGGLRSAQLELLRNAGRLQPYPPGASIFTQGDPSEFVVIIDRGTVKVIAAAENGYVSVLALRGPGELIGEFGCIDGSTRSASIIALTPVTASIIGASQFHQLLQSRPDIMFALLRITIARARGSDRRLVEFSAYSGFDRIVRVLLDHAERADPVGESGSRHLRMPQHELAGLAGVSRETVVRAERNLTKNGVIARTKGRIVIHDVELLRAIVARGQS